MRRDRPRLAAPATLAEVHWTENTRAWHAVSDASARRAARTLCGSTAEGLRVFPALEYPQGPPVHDHRVVCDRCLARVARLAQRDTPGDLSAPERTPAPAVRRPGARTATESPDISEQLFDTLRDELPPTVTDEQVHTLLDLAATMGQTIAEQVTDDSRPRATLNGDLAPVGCATGGCDGRQVLADALTSLADALLVGGQDDAYRSRTALGGLKILRDAAATLHTERVRTRTAQPALRGPAVPAPVGPREAHR